MAAAMADCLQAREVSWGYVYSVPAQVIAKFPNVAKSKVGEGTQLERKPSTVAPFPHLVLQLRLSPHFLLVRVFPFSFPFPSLWQIASTSMSPIRPPWPPNLGTYILLRRRARLLGIAAVLPDIPCSLPESRARLFSKFSILGPPLSCPHVSCFTVFV